MAATIMVNHTTYKRGFPSAQSVRRTTEADIFSLARFISTFYLEIQVHQAIVVMESLYHIGITQQGD